MATEFLAVLWRVLAEASLRACGAAALAALVLSATRARAPGVRHAVWTAITLAMLVMPVLPRALPELRVAALPSADAWPIPLPAPETPAIGGGSTPSRVSAAPAGSAEPVDPVRPAAADRTITWPVGLAWLYLAGLFASLVYVAAGWLAMIGIVRRSRPVALPDGSAARESIFVAAPLTAGVFRPRIVLPATWRAWPAETLRAVVTHERTHISRRDPLIALAARVNRCVFWFHPLAWWLEAKLASVAEFACDETASRACRVPAEYAQVLVEIADDVRRNGGRLAWQGIAISGNGQLKDRIERLLAGPAWPAMSRAKKTLVACACVLAVAIAAACRPATHARELQPDPALAARRAEQNARTARDYEAMRMRPQQAAALETAVARAPDDRESRERLLAYYGDSRRKLDPAAIVARRAHILWMIDHHPDFDPASSWVVRLYTASEDLWLPEPLRAAFNVHADPEGYAQAKSRWLAAIAKSGVTVPTLINAARFFEMADKPLAEAAYLEAAQREPGRWSGELGRLYAFTIVGSDQTLSPQRVQHVSLAAAHSAYAERIRQKLADSTDAALLGSAGLALLNAEWLNTTDKTPPPIDFDVRAEATKYLQRAVEIDPGATPAAAVLAARRLNERSWPVFRSLKGVWWPTPEEVAALPETERLDILWKVIADAFYEGENLYYNKNDKAGARTAWRRLAIYADDALTIGPRHPDHPGTGQAMFNAHEFLGTVALWDGDVRTALAHLDAAPGVPASAEMKYGGSSTSNRLVRNLLRAGEYEAVAQYYDRMARINVRERTSLIASAQAIRAGRMPEWYQLATERESGR